MHEAVWQDEITTHQGTSRGAVLKYSNDQKLSICGSLVYG